MYNSQCEDGSTSSQAEDNLALIDSGASKVARKIIEVARSGDSLDLKESDRQTWAEFTYYQFNRHPDMRDELRRYVSDPNTLDQLEAKMGRPMTLQEIQSISGPSNRIVDNTFAEFLVSTGNEQVKREWVSVLMNKKFGVLAIRENLNEFIIGNSPMIFIPSPTGQEHVNAPGTQFLYPISWDIMAGFGLENDLDLLSASDQEKICNLNKRSFDQSTMIAGRSLDVIKSLVPNPTD